MQEAGMVLSTPSLFRWCKALGLKRTAEGAKTRGAAWRTWPSACVSGGLGHAELAWLM